VSHPKQPPARLFWSERARRDLREIRSFIELDDPAAAKRWVATIISAVERLTDLPLSGRVVPEAGRSDLREVIKGGYRIVYRVALTDIIILTVFKSHRAWRAPK
jgi:addiction module RelE/StbE family toxin